MSKRRLVFGAALILGVLMSPAEPAAQRPSLEGVLERAAIYVAGFRRQLAEIVAEETYRQEITNTARIGGASTSVRPVRTLRSDFLLVKPSDADHHVELRDVFEVDGRPVREGPSRLERLLRYPTADARIGEIIATSARYNIGSIQRTINTPLMPLMFLDADNQERFAFKHIEKATPVFTDAGDAIANDTPVFRVSTEIWTIEYQEKQRPTIIHAPRGENRPAKGRFWINPTNGSVLISELIVDGGGVIATVTVSYQSEPLMGFLVPVEMRESYIRAGERISGRAEYGKFRPIPK